MDIIFSHGAMTMSYEEQANRQGFTLGDKAEKAEELRHAILILLFNDVITDSQRWNIFQRLQKKFLIPNLKENTNEDIS